MEHGAYTPRKEDAREDVVVRSVTDVCAGQYSVSHRDLQYGGRTLEAASDCYNRLRFGQERWEYLRSRSAWRDLWSLTELMCRLPRVRIRPSNSPDGRAIRAHLAQRDRYGVPEHRIVQGILELPASMDDYLSGRPRQAVRSNVRRAEALGLVCKRLESYYARSECADRACFAGVSYRSDMLDWPGRDCWAVVDSDDRLTAIATVTVDGEVAVLWTLVGHESPERWLLHTRIVEALIGSGVRLLLVNSVSAMQLRPGLQYLQRRLGYRLVQLALGPSRP